MSYYKELLKLECQELVEKCDKMHEFFKSHTFYTLSRKEKDLLYKQRILMIKYVQVLGQRMELEDISDFVKE